MNIFKRYNVKSILLTVMWIAIGCSTVALLVAAVHTKDIKHCKGLEIRIHGVSNNFFIDKDDVKQIISAYTGDIAGTRIDGFNLGAMEAELKREVWIKDADLFFDNNGILQATVEEREPIARLFTKEGSSFYIDNSNMILPISDKLSARLPVFTSFPSENKVLSKVDSNLLKDVNKLSLLIQRDSFLMAMIEQVEITPQREFEMIPKIGDQTIVFGDASGAEHKFNKLGLFYKKVMHKYGWNKYSIISLQYKGQVIGKLKGKDDVSADSLRTQEIMREMARNAAMAASDSMQTILQDNERNTTDVSMIADSRQRDDEEEEINPFPKFLKEAAKETAAKPIEKPVLPAAKKPVLTIHKPIAKPAVKPVVKPVVTKPKPVQVKTAPPKKIEKPKAVMEKKNDY